MRYSERLHDFMGKILNMGLSAPDEYFKRSDELRRAKKDLHKEHVEILHEYWQALRPLIKKDVDKIPFIEERMGAALASFAEGKREPGRTLLMEIYNLPLRKLR